MKARLLAVFIVLCIPLCACPSYSVHPLYTDEDAVVEPALEGTWTPGPNDKEELSFQKSGDNEYSLGICNPDTQVRQNYEVHLVRLGGQLFMDLTFKDQTVNCADVEVPFGIVPAHVIVKANISGDDLAYAALEDDAIRKPIIPGSTPLHYAQMPDGPLLVTAQTGALRDYISAHPEDGFSDFEHLKRKDATSK
jgi:hypothetical protein